MEKKYYFFSFLWGLLIFFLAIYDFDRQAMRFSNALPIHPIKLFVDVLLFPFSKRLVENIALRYTTKEFWRKSSLRAAAYNGGLILYYLFCFFFAIPLGAIYIVHLCRKRRCP